MRRIAKMMTGLTLALALAATALLPGMTAQAMSVKTKQEISRNNHAIINSLIESYGFDVRSYLEYYNGELGFSPTAITESSSDGYSSVENRAYSDNTVNCYDTDSQTGYTYTYTYTYDSDHYVISKDTSDGFNMGSLTLNKKKGRVVSLDGFNGDYVYTVQFSYDKYGRISEFYTPDIGYRAHFTYKNNRIVSVTDGNDLLPGQYALTRDANGRVIATKGGDSLYGTQYVNAAYHEDGSLAQLNIVLQSVGVDPLSYSFAYSY